jgi:cell fate regulator YaaT (PSP1 superfamily)
MLLKDKIMQQYAVRLIKNQYNPLSVPESAKVKHGDYVLIRTEKGEEVAKAFLVHEEIAKKWKGKAPEPLSVIRVMSARDMEIYEELKKENAEAYSKCKELVKLHRLNLSLICAKFTFDRRKITFYYTAPARVDFRELLKDLTQTFKRIRIDLRHIGVRDETAILEGCGLCGRAFCCCSWLKNFESINIKLAKDQGMPINPTKISGVCGRLLCCLNYEYSNYMDAAKGMPPVGSGVMTPEGIGRVCALHFLNGIVAVKLQDGKIKDFSKKDIEMIDEDVNNIEIDVPVIYHDEEEAATIDIKTLEDDDTSYTSNV